MRLSLYVFVSVNQLHPLYIYTLHHCKEGIVWLFSWLLLHQMAFIIVAGICACLYFLFLCFMVFQVFRNISGKRTSLPAMSKARRLHYEVWVFIYKLVFLIFHYHWLKTKHFGLEGLLCHMECIFGFNEMLYHSLRVWFSGSSSSCWSLWPALPWLSSSSSSARWVPSCYENRSNSLHN